MIRVEIQVWTRTQTASPQTAKMQKEVIFTTVEIKTSRPLVTEAWT